MHASCYLVFEMSNFMRNSLRINRAEAKAAPSTASVPPNITYTSASIASTPVCGLILLLSAFEDETLEAADASHPAYKIRFSVTAWEKSYFCVQAESVYQLVKVYPCTFGSAGALILLPQLLGRSAVI